MFKPNFCLETFIWKIGQLYPDVTIYKDLNVKTAYYLPIVRVIGFNPTIIEEKQKHYILHELGHYLIREKCEENIFGIEEERLVEFFAWYIILDNLTGAEIRSFSYYAAVFTLYSYREYPRDTLILIKEFLIKEADKVKAHIW